MLTKMTVEQWWNNLFTIAGLGGGLPDSFHLLYLYFVDLEDGLGPYPGGVM